MVSKTEKIRNKYLPQRIKTLFVAEAPPDNPERFFYFPEVWDKDFLFLGFLKYFGGEDTVRTYLSYRKIRDPQAADIKAAFLKQFKADGYFLVDLSPVPVTKESRKWLKNQVPTFMEKLAEFEAEGLINKSTPIVLIKANVYNELYSILSSEGYNVAPVKISFPNNGHQHEFDGQFASALALCESPHSEKEDFSLTEQSVIVQKAPTKRKNPSSRKAKKMEQNKKSESAKKERLLVYLIIGLLLAAMVSVSDCNKPAYSDQPVKREPISSPATYADPYRKADCAPSTTPKKNGVGVPFESKDKKSEADIYNDRIDEYLADPEDESEFPPEIFDYYSDYEEIP